MPLLLLYFIKVMVLLDHLPLAILLLNYLAVFLEDVVVLTVNGRLELLDEVLLLHSFQNQFSLEFFFLI